MVSLYVYDTKNIQDVLLTSNLDYHCNLYKNELKRKISRYAYYLLSVKLKEQGYDPSLITFTKSGKGIHDDIYFSISHSKSYISIAISNSNIGVDVEDILSLDRLKLASKILNEEELDIFNARLDKCEYLTEKWTLKEAFGKYLGEGITSDVLKSTIVGHTYNVLGAMVSIYPSMPNKFYLNEREIELWKISKRS